MRFLGGSGGSAWIHRGALKDYLPEPSLRKAAVAFAAGIAVSGLVGAGIMPGAAAAAEAGAAAAFLCLAVLMGGRRQRDLEMSPEEVGRISACLGICMLALFFCLGMFRHSGAAWPGAGRDFTEGFPVSGAGVVEEIKPLAASAYAGPRYQVTLRLLDHGGSDAKLWRRQKKILLTVRFDRGGEGEALGEAFGKEVLPGARVSFTAAVKHSEKPRNPGEFDYGAYLRTKGVYCRGEAEGRLVVMERKPDRVQRLIASARGSIITQVERHLDPKAAGVVAGCLLGNQTLMEREDREVYRQAGVAHLFAVSGTHGGIILTLALHLERLGPFRKRKGLSRALALGLLLFYLCLTGFPLSMKRTFVMACMMQGAVLLGRKGETLDALAAAVFVLLWLSPQALFSSGFQLSFGVTWGIIHLNPWLRKLLPSWLAVPVAAQLAAMPAQAFWFYQIQPAGFLINLGAVAMMPPLLLLSALAALAGFFGDGLAALLWQAPGFLASILDRAAFMWTSLPFASVNIKAYPWPAYVLCGFCLWLLPGMKVKEAALEQWLYQRYLRKKRQADWRRWQDWRGEKQRQIREREAGGRAYEEESGVPDTFSAKETNPGLVWRLWQNRKPAGAALAALGLAAYLLLPGPLYICFLDVGQGDGVFLKMPSGCTWMIDGGSSNVGRLADYRLAPFLRSQGVNRLDYVLLSHMDEDHVSGVRELLTAGWPIGCLILSPQAAAEEAGKELIALAREKGAKSVCLSGGQAIRDGQVALRCLYPGEADGGGANELCLVVELTYKRFSLLLTGDIDSRIEEELRGAWSGASLLKVAHHGSKYSTGADFLERVKPRVSVISSSRNNIYGHPSPDTLERLNEAGSLVYMTMERGAVRVTTDGKSFRVDCFIND
ncbi:MAG: ComEC/Rec2 family competence protein [Clostridiales bacterium]|nr:ComEC/Rec2 family competence protein [Clostridiales bacterium]